MKIFTIAIASFFAIANAANGDDVEFLTNLVNDYKSHTKDYAKFIQTADTVPAVLTSLALQVATYKDDSYTTLLDKSGINVKSLESFATELPWYSSRLADAGDAAETGDATGTGSSSDSTDDSEESDEASSSAAASSSSSSEAGVAHLVAPAGAILGAIAVALM